MVTIRTDDDTLILPKDVRHTLYAGLVVALTARDEVDRHVATDRALLRFLNVRYLLHDRVCVLLGAGPRLAV